ncbi:hypothetical protein P691DRAFT_774297 [Macrolepiota fuliginosa MF-IS2]|uniref:F-box domain-containing protein n=1 Tax=Macrolepiota fuliginosa MF-IS2 TaxID=1400762 RepID=A0A9P6C2W6_9AGAR|nr:hypothetical protein P691DRAFT_774297 [Macrolepiota fuliginosa MF-IS2]
MALSRAGKDIFPDKSKTCRALHNILASQHFWRNLAAGFRPDPTLGSQLDDYSTKELMQWTLRRLRSQAQLNSSDPLRFHARMIAFENVENVGRTDRVELLSGGRWMFSFHECGAGYVTDLDEEQPQPRILFTRPSEYAFHGSCTWVDQDQPLPSLYVAVFNHHMKEHQKGNIFRISFKKDSSTTFIVKRLSVIRDGPYQAIRMSTAVSKEYFIQQITQLHVPEGVSKLQLRRFSPRASTGTMPIVERPIPITSGPAHLFFLPGNRIGSITRNGIEILSFNNSTAADGTAMLDLVSVHHIPGPHDPDRMSPPFIKSNHIYLLSAYRDTLERIIIDHDTAVPPTSEEIGKVVYDRSRPTGQACFGPSTCVLIPSYSKPLLELATCEFNAPGAPHISCREYDRTYDPPLSRPLMALAFDETSGRVVFETDLHKGRPLVMEFI